MKIQLSTALLILLLIAIIGLLGQRACINNLKAKLKEKCPEGVVKVDTVKVRDSSSTGWYRPEPKDSFQFLQGGNIAGAEKKESHNNSTEVPQDSPEDPVISRDTDISADDYFYRPLSYYYADTVSVGTYGKIIIQDTSLGPIVSRRVLKDFTLPVVTKTNTITLKEPPRMRGFLSILAQGNQFYPLQAAGGGFLLQFKNYNAVEVDALYNFHPLYPGQVPWTYQVSYKPLITFRKK
jgi:hypothetical protein